MSLWGAFFSVIPAEAGIQLLCHCETVPRQSPVLFPEKFEKYFKKRRIL